MSSLRVLIVGCALLTACSSAGSGTAIGPSTSSSSPGTASANSSAAIATYVDAVNKLCDALLPKVIKAVHGGHVGTYPVSTYLAEVKVTNSLEADFDKQLAAVPVPPAAAKAHAAIQAYITYADGLTAKRVAAAARGQAAFDKEIEAEGVETLDDPNIINRDAQGFNSSCNAR